VFRGQKKSEAAASLRILSAEINYRSNDALRMNRRGSMMR
jgi:hypothetical protein